MEADGPRAGRPRRHVVVADARCLQDPNFAGRGVGRHALALVAGFPADRGIDLVALTDPALPALEPEVAALFAAVATTPYAAAHATGWLAAFVCLSPMTHDPLLTASLLGRAGVPATAAVFDFIPFRNPARYLPTHGHSLAYTLSLYWLRRFDRFAPISRAAADDLQHHLAPPPGTVRVTGAPLADGFAVAVDRAADEAERGPQPRSGLLVVGGMDSRKDPETVVRAHAGSAAMQGTRTILTVAGNYPPEHYRALFAGIAAAAGGDPALVHVPGHLPETDLAALYRSAAAVVCPSIDEGFSLPLVEGMAAGAVVYASDIPPHRELVPDPDRLFPPGDAGRLAAILEAGLADPGRRTAILAAQDEVWPRFRAARVAERFWSHALSGLAPAFPSAAAPLPAPAVSRRALPRIAILSPLPPERSGVADYTAATCAALAGLAELDIFTETRDPAPVPGVSRILPLTDLPCIAPCYDRTISVLGNSDFHGAIFDRLTRYGGAAIAHDARMLGFYSTRRGGPATIAEIASRELGRPVHVSEALAWIQDERGLATALLSDVAAVSTPLIVHSPVTQSLLKDRLDIESVLLPFCIYRPFAEAELAPGARAAARARLGLPQDGAVLATFGFVDLVKAPLDCLWALEVLRGWGIDASLHYVGRYDERGSNMPSLRGLAAELGVAGHVRFFDGFTSEAVFRDYLLAADVAIQLRTYGHGGLSGAVLDCAAAGLPVVGNDGLVRAVAPPAILSRAIPDLISPVLLAEAVADLLATGRGAEADEARRSFAAERSFTRYARELMTALDLPCPDPL